MKLLWIDIETTGLDPHTNHILEVGMIVTENMNTIGMCNYVVRQPAAVLTTMPPEVAAMHEASGLSREVSDTYGNFTLAQVEVLSRTFIRNHFGDLEPVVIAGNTISFDRGFLKVHMPTLASRFHYRQLDVSSLKIAFEGMLGVAPYPKKKAHRAIDDLHESIGELAYYLQHIKENL